MRIEMCELSRYPWSLGISSSFQWLLLYSITIVTLEQQHSPLYKPYNSNRIGKLSFISFYHILVFFFKYFVPYLYEPSRINKNTPSISYNKYVDDEGKMMGLYT
ncbi:hypothetical protein V8G54_010535, partial [Vigna mungo]